MARAKKVRRAQRAVPHVTPPGPLPARPAGLATRLSPRLRLTLAAAAALLLLVWLRWNAPAPRSYDEYFHLGLAREMRSGLRVESFPWTPFSTAYDRFVDKEPLFHLALMPFAGLRLETATLLGTLLGQLFVVGAFAWAFWTLRVPHASWLLLALPALGSLFLSRLLTCRPHLWLIGFAVLTIALLAAERWKSLFVSSALFGLSHIAGWIAVPMAALWAASGLVVRDGADGVPRRKVPWQPVAAAAGGWLAGQLLHPAVPANFVMIALQSFVVPFQATTGASAALQTQLGTELKPPGFDLASEQWPALLLGAVVLFALLRHKALRSRATVTAGAFAVAFLLAALQIRRFFELGAPLALLALALLVRERERRHVDGWFARGAIGTVAFALPLALLSTVALDSRYDSGKWSPPQQMAQWLGEHGQPGDRVFTAQWADSSPLFYSAPQLQSMVAVDSTFFFEKDPALFATYTKIVAGKQADALRTIRERFGARWVSVWKIFPTFGKQLQDEGGSIAYHDRDYVVFDLGPPPAGTPRIDPRRAHSAQVH
jgi:hypothetical protein